jgi:anti-sigma factor RsiW
MTRCHEIRPYLEAFVDDELSTDNCLRVREHLGGCHRCSEEVELTGALKRSLREAVLEEARPSAAFMERLSGVIAEERRRAEQSLPQVLPWRRRAVPMAAAAAVVLAWGLSDGQWLKLPWLGGLGGSLSSLSAGASEGAASASSAMASGTSPHQQASFLVNPQNIIDQLVHYHQAPTEPEVTDRSALLRLEPQVGVPMRVPELQQYGARFLGASVVPVERHRAASLRYNLGDHRVTVYVFNPQVVSVRALQELQPRVVGDRAVFVGMRHGYSIAAIEQRGVGYMIATDLDDRESVELLASIH